MSDPAFVLGTLASALGPMLLVLLLLRRWLRRLRTLLVVLALALGAGWLGMGAFLSQAFADFGVGFGD